MKSRSALILIISFTLSACLYTARPPRPVVIRTEISQTQVAQPAVGEKVTPSPSQEELPTPQETMQVPAITPNIATIIADPGPRFIFAHIYSLAYLDDGQLLVTVEVPGGVNGQFFARLGQEIFKCVILEAYPNRLYCNGETSQAGLIVPFLVFSLGETQASFITEIGIPPLPLEVAAQSGVASNRAKDKSP